MSEVIVVVVMQLRPGTIRDGQDSVLAGLDGVFAHSRRGGQAVRGVGG